MDMVVTPGRAGFTPSWGYPSAEVWHSDHGRCSIKLALPYELLGDLFFFPFSRSHSCNRPTNIFTHDHLLRVVPPTLSSLPFGRLPLLPPTLRGYLCPRTLALSPTHSQLCPQIAIPPLWHLFPLLPQSHPILPPVLSVVW